MRGEGRRKLTLKICPNCQRTYADDALRFCLQDGSQLQAATTTIDDSSAAPVSPPLNDEFRTLVMQKDEVSSPLVPPATFAPPPPRSSSLPPPTAQPQAWPPPSPLPQQFNTPTSPPPAAYDPTGPAATGRRRRWLPWVLGGGAALLALLVVVIAGGLYVLSRMGAKPASGGTPVRSVKKFVNARGGITGKLAENYFDFSFDYPTTWTINPQGGSSNFVQVSSKDDDGQVMESFAVGSYQGTGTMRGDKVMLPLLVTQLDAQLKKSVPGYQKISEGATKVGRYEGYELRFTGRLTEEMSGGRRRQHRLEGGAELMPAQESRPGASSSSQASGHAAWGRIILVPSGDASKPNSASLFLLATDRSTEVKGVNQVGTRGELPVILDSFRMEATSSTVPSSSGGRTNMNAPPAPASNMNPPPAAAAAAGGNMNTDDDGSPAAISAGVLNGKIINQPPPAYPPAARAVKASGAVVVQVTVDEEGQVVTAKAVSGHPLLRAAAEQSARQTRLSPTRLSGRAVKVTGTITYNFTL